MFVGINIQSAEVTSPNISYVGITDLLIKSLIDPISVTIPLISALNTSNLNRTLGCGYLDESDGIFKSDGLSIIKISNTLVTCNAKHLTAIGVEEFTSERTAD